MEERFGPLSDEARSFILKESSGRQISLKKLFDEANGVGLLDFALALAKEGKEERAIYDAMLKRIERDGGYFGRR
jgi:hypothetical protein